MIRCQQTPEVGIRRIHPQYTPGLGRISHRISHRMKPWSACRPFIIN